MQNLDKTEKGIGWVERLMQLVDKYSIWKFLKAFLIIIATAMLVGIISNPTYIFEKYKEWADNEHSERIEQRMKNNEKLHLKAEQLMYRVSADRVMVLELHNGLENSVGLPFSKCSATYEALNVDTQPIAEQYQNVNLSLMPFATYLFHNGYWCGDTEELAEIDRGLYYKMKANGTEHFAACLVEGVDKPLAFLFVSYQSIPDAHQCDVVRENIRHISLETALLLELNK